MKLSILSIAGIHAMLVRNCYAEAGQTDRAMVIDMNGFLIIFMNLLIDSFFGSIFKSA